MRDASSGLHDGDEVVMRMSRTRRQYPPPSDFELQLTELAGLSLSRWRVSGPDPVQDLPRSVADREAEEKHREQPRECIFSKPLAWPLIGPGAKITRDCALIGRDEPGQRTTTSPQAGHVTWPPPCWIGSLRAVQTNEIQS